MPQRLEGEKKLRRVIKLYGVEGDTIITLTAQGIEFKAKGTKSGISATWVQIADAMNTPATVPARFHKQPLSFLAYQAEQFAIRKARRLEVELTKERRAREVATQ